MEEFVDFAKDANILLCESNFYSDMGKNGSNAGHMTAREAGVIANKANVQLLNITHYRVWRASKTCSRSW